MPVGLHHAVSRACGERQAPVGGLCPAPGAPRGKEERSRGAYCAGSVGPRSRGDRGRGCPGRCPRVDRAHGAGKGSPRAHRGLLRVGAEVSGQGPCGRWPRCTPAQHRPGGSPTFEAVSTQTLELILARGHACGTVATGLALTRRAVVALPDTPAAQEAVGEVQPLSVH